MNGLKLISRGTVSFDLEKVYDHCKANSDEYSLVQFYLSAAILACENELQSPIVTSVWELNRSCWDSPVSLGKGTVSAINSVKYYDTDAVQQTVSSSLYRSLNFVVPAQVEFTQDFTQPSLDDRLYPIVINFSAGYSASADIPSHIFHAVLLETVDRYENRQNEAANITIAMFSNNAKALLASESLWL